VPAAIGVCAADLGRLRQSLNGAGASGMRHEPYRWRLSGSFVAHLFKAATRQHHRDLYPLFARFVPAAGVVFDVGAHAGQHTKLFARAASAGRVYAFEPGSYARAILRAAIALRRLDNVTVLPIALGSRCGVETLSVPVKQGGSFGFGLSHLGAPQARWERVAQEIVATATLDTVAAALGLERLDLVMADIEGWELALLRGGEASLRRFRPLLVLELLSSHLARAGDRVEDAFAFLAGLGYTAFTLTPQNEIIRVTEVRDGEYWFIAEERL
jgi:FkbM family methyltransferase